MIMSSMGLPHGCRGRAKLHPAIPTPPRSHPRTTAVGSPDPLRRLQGGNSHGNVRTTQLQSYGMEYMHEGTKQGADLLG
jgi:hypothetical protein